MATLVTVHAPDGRAFGPYSISLGTVNAPTLLKEYEREALVCAREDDRTDKVAAGCNFDVVYTKDGESA